MIYRSVHVGVDEVKQLLVGVYEEIILVLDDVSAVKYPCSTKCAISHSLNLLAFVHYEEFES